MSRALEIARQRGLARARDFISAGVPAVYLRRLRDRGDLVRAGRGLYTLPGAEPAAARSLAEVARIAPGATICLLSALQFHELTTQTPHEVWVMLASGAWTPKSPSAALRVVRASGASLVCGTALHPVGKVSVSVTTPAKTVADCFKYRGKIGIDIAIEALRDCLRLKKASVDELWHFATCCRVANVMRPYLEAML